jgi:hypothetical protein
MCSLWKLASVREREFDQCATLGFVWNSAGRVLRPDDYRSFSNLWGRSEVLATVSE